MGRLIGIVIVIILAIAVLMPQREPKELTEEEKAQRAIEAAQRDEKRKEGYCTGNIESVVQAQKYVRSQLRSPSSASFKWGVEHAHLGDCRHYVKGEVDAQNAFGATIRNTYEVTLVYDREADRFTITGFEMN